MPNIAIFASGGGSNARKIIEYFKDSATISVALVVCNKPGAGVLDIASEHNITSHLINRKSFYETTDLLDVLREKEIKFIVLAGFLWLIPTYLVKAFPRRIVNIHPALLPKYGGKGMYGIHVHEAVKAAGDLESGITIHMVNEHYDEGDIVFQARCTLDASDEPSKIARKVLMLEHRHFPEVIGELVSNIRD